jgi:hypothetical protein
MVIKSPEAPIKKGAPTRASKRPKRVVSTTTSLEAHRPTTSSDNVSSASCARLFLLFDLFFILLPSADINAEVPLSW